MWHSESDLVFLSFSCPVLAGLENDSSADNLVSEQIWRPTKILAQNKQHQLKDEAFKAAAGPQWQLPDG